MFNRYVASGLVGLVVGFSAVGVGVSVRADVPELRPAVLESQPLEVASERVVVNIEPVISSIGHGSYVVGVIEKSSSVVEVVDMGDYYIVEMLERPYDFKSFMDYRMITTGKQLELQGLASTDTETGIRVLNGRYMVAVGTGVCGSVGTEITLVLENGTEIECIVGDIKADIHTDETNTITSANWCVSEFIVETELLPSNVQSAGSVSKCFSEWQSPVVEIKVY